MTPTEFKAARRWLDLTARQLGDILGGVTTSTIYRWENKDGRYPPPPLAVIIMGWFLDGFRPPQWPG